MKENIKHDKNGNTLYYYLLKSMIIINKFVVIVRFNENEYLDDMIKSIEK